MSRRRRCLGIGSNVALVRLHEALWMAFGEVQSFQQDIGEVLAGLGLHLHNYERFQLSTYGSYVHYLIQHVD